MESPIMLGLAVGGDACLVINQELSGEEVLDVIYSNTGSNADWCSPNSSYEQSSIKQYEEEWEFMSSQNKNLTELRQRALTGRLRACRFRSVCWRLLLGVLSPGQTDRWVEQTRLARENYRELWEKLSVDPWTDERGTDPLSQEVEGMHEILAPLLFVIHCDHQAYLHIIELDDVSDIVCELLDPKYVEEDSYGLFLKVMFAIQGSYQISNIAPSNTGYFPATSSPSSPVSENQVLHQLNWIRDHLLAPIYPELHQHLQQLDISLPLFGIRWLRLLFGREFPLQDLLVLWDAIFAEGNMFQLVNYLVVAMLIAVRHQLLTSDYTSCLTTLMRYPGTMDISCIIDHALHLKNPQNYEQPSQTALPNLPSVTVAGQYNTNKGPKDVNKQQRLLDKKQDARQRNSMTNRLKKLSAKHSSQDTSLSENSNIIDGFMLDDPALVRTELKHCRALMSLVQLKLAQYHEVLDQCVPHTNIAAQQALTGIHELCSLLDPHRMSPSPSSCIEVEPAYEVGEVTTPPAPTNLPPPHSDVDMTILKQSQGEATETLDNLLRFPDKR